MRCFIIGVSFLAGACVPGRVFAEEPQLIFSRGNEEASRRTLSELLKSVKPKKIRIFDPFHGKEKTYRCLPLQEVMDAAFGSGWGAAPLSEAVFTTADGYAPVASAEKLRGENGCLAFEDLDFPGWEPIGKRKTYPGPFYLVWRGESHSSYVEHPWPWQLIGIGLIAFEQAYPEVAPQGEPASSAAWRGYGLFRSRCLRCHAINRQGGTVGPDLNAPQSITNYRSKRMIKEFIRRPSSFRYTGMPDHPELTDRDLEDLYRYLKVKSGQPEKKW